MLATRRLYIFLLWTPMVATFEIPVDVTSSLGGDTAMASVWRNFAQSGLLLDLPPLGNNRRFICIRKPPCFARGWEIAERCARECCTR